MYKNNISELLVETNFVEFFDEVRPFKLENGESLSKVRVAYQTYGELNAEGNNAVLICHALTGNSHAAGVMRTEESDRFSDPDLVNKYSKMFLNKTGWWDGLIGPGKVFDTDKYFVVCPNVLGSCYGSTGPVSLKPNSHQTYKADFPEVTVRDMVRVQKELIDHLGINKIKTISGGSLGGMQVLEWAVMYPDLVESIIPMASSAQHSPWTIGFGDVERDAITNDPEWKNGYYNKQPVNGMALARKIAMLSYRTMHSYYQKFGREMRQGENFFDPDNQFQISSYLEYQGLKLVKRFDANTYLTLADAMDYHDLGYGRGRIEDVLGTIKAKTLAVGIDTDILYPVVEQQFIADNINDAEFAELKSLHGHDAFLIEFDQLNDIIGTFFDKNNL